jgi:hypothetical protein
MKESSKWINTMNILQHQLKERVILYNENSKAKDLLTKVQNNAKLLFDASKDIDFSFIKNTKKILVKHPEAEKLFNEALDKYVNGIYQRNLLDDMRLALELFLKSFFKNNKSLENQKSAIGVYQEESNASKELSNMFNKLVEYYAKYHNEHVKHNDKVIQKEIGFVINLTTCFIMYFN